MLWHFRQISSLAQVYFHVILSLLSAIIQVFLPKRTDGAKQMPWRNKRRDIFWVRCEWLSSDGCGPRGPRSSPETSSLSQRKGRAVRSKVRSRVRKSPRSGVGGGSLPQGSARLKQDARLLAWKEKRLARVTGGFFPQDDFWFYCQLHGASVVWHSVSKLLAIRVYSWEISGITKLTTTQWTKEADTAAANILSNVEFDPLCIESVRQLSLKQTFGSPRPIDCQTWPVSDKLAANNLDFVDNQFAVFAGVLRSRLLETLGACAEKRRYLTVISQSARFLPLFRGRTPDTD